ncbi:NupC/NupG family nucleoside CNT transporter [Candidatus Phycosocius spiralis]|uniref:Sodium dependent nucleoside transporter n=1 Tax=Candidatus Phycosocius spiralis TaxID=2815099 RepID=A0ABQ4PYM3_9PROT|nr:nucleoside transporter C-terminal domain-containing protein [Candidatus Phycosocius spiralis]GIU68132.1 sodium dependent nucleoside transporter [Candidatus Phycosocius spiralis]
MEWGWDNVRAMLGAIAIVGLSWGLSENRKMFPWRLALGAMAVQVFLVVLLFGVPASQGFLNGVNGAVDGLNAATIEGTKFVFGYLGGGEPPYVVVQPGAPPPFVFAFQVLPLILVISALSAVLWHWKILQWITRGFGFIFEKSMGLGGASALATAANIFMGMVESPIVIKGYLDKLSRSELFMMMVVGLATVAGSTMVAYAAILSPTLPNAAGHVLVASIITAPAGILLARIMIPEQAGYFVDGMDYSSALAYESTMDAITKGVQDGMMVVVNVGAFLLVFVSFVWIANGLLSTLGTIGGEALTLQHIFGYLFAPLAYVIGIPTNEMQKAGGLLGSKLFLTEFVAFIELGAIPVDALSERSRMIMTYALCGFANVGSVGIMTGGMTVLMPERRNEILKLAWKALIPGFLATCLSATIVAALPMGVFVH